MSSRTVALRASTGASMLLLLNGCMVGPNFVRPTPPEEPSYRQQPGPAPAADAPGPDRQRVEAEATIAGDWWQLFHSDELDAIVKQAIEGNQNLVAMKATLGQTEELALAATGQLYPQVGITGGVGRQKYGAEFLGGFFNLPPFTYFAVGPTVSYRLDYNGGVARNVEREFAVVDSARQQFDAAYLSITGQVVMQAVANASIRQQIAMLEELVAQDRNNLKLVEGAFEAGSVARIDVLTAQSQIDSDLTLLPPLRQDLARSRHALAVLLGHTPAGGTVREIDLEKVPLPMVLPVGLPSELAHRRPDILQAEAELHAATSAVGIAEANLYPQIQLTATLAQQARRPSELVDGSATAWSLISGVTAPLFDGGSLRAQKRAAVDALHASAARYQETVLQAFGQVADLLDALDHDGEQFEAQTLAQQTASSALDLARASYAEGNAGILQVLDAQRSYLRSRLGLARASAQRYLDTAQLILALGGSDPSAPATVANR
jgi:NodT family efflux transporter outer membrane factor (OMF) lipoprotein